MAAGYRHPDGTYEGDVNPDTLIPHGYGVYYYKNGDEYHGNFNTSIREGFGVMEYANGDRFDGTFHRGYAKGYGKYDFANGDCHVGEYLRGKRHGAGKLVYKTGAVYEGRFRRGSKKDNYGKYTYPNGDIYYGKFKDDKPFGRGKLITQIMVEEAKEVEKEDEPEWMQWMKKKLKKGEPEPEPEPDPQPVYEERKLDVWNGKLIEKDHKGNYINFDPAWDVDEEDSTTTPPSHGSDSGDSIGSRSISTSVTPLSLSRAGSPTLELDKTVNVTYSSPGMSLADALSVASLDRSLGGSIDRSVSLDEERSATSATSAISSMDRSRRK